MKDRQTKLHFTTKLKQQSTKMHSHQLINSKVKVACVNKLTSRLIQLTSTIQLELESLRILKDVFSIVKLIISALVSILHMIVMELVNAGFGLNLAMLVMEFLDLPSAM